MFKYVAMLIIKAVRIIKILVIVQSCSSHGTRILHAQISCGYSVTHKFWIRFQISYIWQLIKSKLIDLFIKAFKGQITWMNLSLVIFKPNKNYNFFSTFMFPSWLHSWYFLRFLMLENPFVHILHSLCIMSFFQVLIRFGKGFRFVSKQLKIIQKL